MTNLTNNTQSNLKLVFEIILLSTVIVGIVPQKTCKSLTNLFSHTNNCTVLYYEV